MTPDDEIRRRVQIENEIRAKETAKGCFGVILIALFLWFLYWHSAYIPYPFS